MDRDLFRVLPHLPTSGPMYIPFSLTGKPTYSEGYVVEFLPHSKDKWVGNFEKGLTLFSKAITHPNGRWVLVVSGGQGYIIDPTSKSLVSTDGGSVVDLIEVGEREMVILQSPVGFSAIGAEGDLWTTCRLSLEAFRSVQIRGDTLIGEAWGIDDSWIPFEVQLASGDAVGGAPEA